MTHRPSPTAKNALVDSRIRSVNSEFEGLKKFCCDADMRGTFLFFGSARARSAEQLHSALEGAEKILNDPNATEMDRAKAASNFARAKPLEWLCPYWDATRELGKLLTVWARSDAGVRAGLNVHTNFPEAHAAQQPLIVCTGGGPGFMEAANKGAMEAEGVSMGIGVELPFETRLNDYLTHGHTCNTFYARKYWEVFCAKAMIVCPGGVGTCDEMFEVLTLMQCQKMPTIPVVLLGREFWTKAINMRYLADCGVMSHAEIDSLCITDDAQEACDFIARVLEAEAEKNIATA